MFIACIVWLKLVSFAHTNHDIRKLITSGKKVCRVFYCFLHLCCIFFKLLPALCGSVSHNEADIHIPLYLSFFSLWFFKYIWNTTRGAFDLIELLIFFCHKIYLSIFLLVRGKLLESSGKEILAFLLLFSLYFLNTSEILPKTLRIILTYQICLPTLVVFLVLFGYSLGVVTCDILCTKGILTIFTVNFGSVLRKFMNCCLSPLDVPSFLQLNLLPCYF